MELVRSNRTETLADALADRVRADPLGPLEAEAIVVQSRGMERWLSLALAERLGVWSNPSFPFPRHAIERLLEDLEQGPDERARAYDPPALKWTIAGLLADEPPRDLAPYLGDSVDADRALRLAGSLAAVFDSYVVYRPQRLQAWARGEDSQWQAELWRRVVDALGPHDLASRIARAWPSLQEANLSTRLRYKRLHLFSLETLPPSFLSFFGAVSKSVPTRLYLLAPTTEYFSDTGDEGQLLLGIEPSAGDGHPMLTSLGGLARDFQELLLESDASIELDEDRFVTPDRHTLLGSLRADILEFRGPPDPAERHTIEAIDPSISVHACTSPMREVQVLHDLIREALEADTTLQPEDVVVMTPELESYAPAFRAVFGQPSEHRIPFEVHDRRTREDTAFYDDFLAVLEVLDSRFSVLDIVRLMDAQSWRPEFRFSSSERARLAELLEASGIRWGIDAAHREALGFPAEPLHTWRSGLSRLFLGFATSPGTSEVFDGLLPRGDLGLGDAELVARLSHLCRVLFDFHENMKRAAPVTSWVSALGELSTDLFAEEDDASGAVHTLRASLETIGESAQAHGFRQAVPLRTMRREVGSALARGTPPAGFLRRGVTLSELVPLRSIPFRMLCLLGMNEESFPRSDDRPSFDLMRAEHHLGDRNNRHDDRHSFLQGVLCARDRLVVTFSASGTSTRHKPCAAAPVVDLIETINRYYRIDGAETVLAPVEHPLHAFDAAYFERDGALVSFSERHAEVARVVLEPAVKPGRVTLVAAPDEEPDAVSIAELAQWIWHPTREFIQKQLRTRFDESALYEPTGALTELGKLEAFRVGNEALERRLSGARLKEFLAASPEFPDGSWGAADRANLAGEIESILGACEANRGTGKEHARVVGARVGGVLIEGRLDGLFDEKRVKQRFNRVGTKTELTTWLEHLLMQIADTAALPKVTDLHLRASGTHADRVRFTPVDGAQAAMESLVALFLRSRREPVALLNRPSFLFAELIRGGKAIDKALLRAKNALRNQQRWDHYGRFAWGREGPFADPTWSRDFCETTLTVYQPFFEHRDVK